MKKRVVKFFLVVIVLILCLLGVYAEEDLMETKYSRDPPVHQYLSYQAYLMLSGNMKEEIGEYIGGPDECVRNFCGLETDGKSITEGAYEEDQLGMWMKHFWDPDTGNGLHWNGYDYQSAYSRAEELWEECLDEYSNGNEERAYYLLGRVTHLLADMSVPAHVHNDIHTPVDKDSYEEYMSVHYNEYTPNPLPPWKPKTFFEIFYWLAEEADDFDSDDVCGEGTVCKFTSWCVGGKDCGIREKDCEYIANYMISRTIMRIGLLYELFWVETEHNKEYEIKINSPENKDYGDRQIQIEIQSNFKLDKIIYEENGRENLLCRNCQNYSRMKNFNEGVHKITIKGIDSGKIIFEENIEFFIDSKKPRIYSVEPRGGFANGLFKISFKEESPVKLTLNYGGREKDLEIKDCYEKSGKTNCEVQVDLREFDGENVNYWFELEDKLGNVEKSRETEIDVDLSKPIIKYLNYEIDGRRVKFEIKIDEKNFDSVDYFDGKRWKLLCSNLKEGECKITKTFAYGDYNFIIRVSDLAGNYVEEIVEFEIRKG